MMKKNYKRFLSILLSVSMLVSMNGISVMAQEISDNSASVNEATSVAVSQDVTESQVATTTTVSEEQPYSDAGFSYVIHTADSYAVCVSYTGQVEDINVPSTVTFEGTSYPVVISGKLFAGNTTAKTITFAEGATAIGDCSEMFAGCTALVSVDAQYLDMSKVTAVANMFNGDTALESVKTPVNAAYDIELPNGLGTIPANSTSSVELKKEVEEPTEAEVTTEAATEPVVAPTVSEDTTVSEDVVILSIIVGTYITKILVPMLLYPKLHNIAYV